MRRLSLKSTLFGVDPVNMIVFKGEKEEWTAEQNKIIRSFTAANNNGRSRVLKGLKPVSEYD